MQATLQKRPAVGARRPGSALAPAWARYRALNRRPAVAVAASMRNSRTAELRRLLRGNDILLGPCCHDGLSARLIESAGFPYAFMSGFCTAGARLGAPDTGLISYAEMLDTGRNIHEATHSIPIIGDGDTGYGNAMNVKRTVRGYAQAGFAGILIEDQIAPKSCGHVRGKKVVGREEAVSRIRAAVDARNEGADILIVARTDARQAVSLEEALWRARAFAEAGADVLFIDALESEEEMRAFCRLGGAAGSVPKMANMLEGGGKTPVLTPAELQAMGFKLVAYPLSLLGVSIRAMQDALEGLKRGRVPPPAALGSFAEIQAAVGFPEYYEQEKRYAISAATSGAQAAAPPPPPPPPPPPLPKPPVVEAEVLEDRSQSDRYGASWPSPPDSSKTTSSTSSAGAGAGAAGYTPSNSFFRNSSTYRPTSSASSSSSSSTSPSSAPSSSSYTPSSSTPTPTTPPPTANDSANDPNYRRNRSLRVRIADRETGLVKLETRVPAGFLNGLTAMVPQLAGVKIEAMLEQALGPGAAPQPGQPIINIANGRDQVQVFLD